MSFLDMRMGLMKFVKLNEPFGWMLMRESYGTKSMGHFWAFCGSFGRYGFLRTGEIHKDSPDPRDRAGFGKTNRA